MTEREWKTPGIDLPENPFKGKPGSYLKDKFENQWGFKTQMQGHGCNCQDLADKMDRLGPHGCMAHIGQLSREILQSAAGWFEMKYGRWTKVAFRKEWGIPFFRHEIKEAVKATI